MTHPLGLSNYCYSTVPTVATIFLFLLRSRCLCRLQEQHFLIFLVRSPLFISTQLRSFVRKLMNLQSQNYTKAKVTFQPSYGYGFKEKSRTLPCWSFWNLLSLPSAVSSSTITSRKTFLSALCKALRLDILTFPSPYFFSSNERWQQDPYARSSWHC